MVGTFLLSAGPVVVAEASGPTTLASAVGFMFMVSLVLARLAALKLNRTVAMSWASVIGVACSP